MKKLLLILVLVVFSSPSIAAETAECSISIDNQSDSVYTIKHKFRYEKDGATQWKKFKIPGHNEYRCNLAFTGLGNGTMLSCVDLRDMGHTFFQSDRSILQDANTDNNLSFRHESAQVFIKTKCR